MDRYPLAVYEGGTCTDEQAADVDDSGHSKNSRVVTTPEEEEAANADGFYAIGEAPGQEPKFAPGVTRASATRGARKNKAPAEE